MTQVVIRAFDEARDTPFVYACWRSNVFGSGVNLDTDTPWEEWFTYFNHLLKMSLPHATVYIACLQDDPDFNLGFSAVFNGALQFIYIKQLFRKQGIAAMLLKKHELNCLIHWNPLFLTRMGLSIVLQHPNIFKSEEAIEKEESNGPINQENDGNRN